MSSTVTYNALKARLSDQLGGSYAIRDWEEIEIALQQGTAPFLALDDGTGLSNLDSIGTPTANWTTESSSIFVHIFVPSTGSLSVARSIADQVRTAVQFYYYPVPAGQTLRTRNVNPAGDGVIHDGLWHSMLVAVDLSHRYAVATAAE